MSIELPSDSSEALRDALARMQRTLEEVKALLEKSQIRFDTQASALEQAAAEASRQARDMSTLNTIADVISRSSVLEEVLSNALDKVLEATETRMGIVLVLSDFMAIVSHELRTPLASIIGYVDLMLDEETGPLNEEQNQYLRVIERNAERLSRLIDDILDITF